MDGSFFVAELLELILLHLDMKTLLVSASRVCRYWATTIADSPKIRQALFFQPVSSVGAGRPESFTFNPLLEGKYTYSRRAYSFLRLPWAPEGAIAKQGPPGSLRLEKSKRLEILTRSNSSWRRMLVSQPPPPSLGYVRYDDVNKWFRESHSTQIDPSSPQQGLTMGQLYDMVHSTICDREDYSVWYRVSWGKPRDSHQIEDHKEVLQLLTETNVVVAFSGGRQYYPDFDCGPWDIVSVREAFRSEGCGDSKVEKLVYGGLCEFLPRRLDVVTTQIWYDTLEDDSTVGAEGCGYGYDRWPHQT
ncbi:hypothetical protein HYE68_006417 [Fusarium pseudograminearum]|nr:hypothetical protein HYE68_006417 [Fusarium pseudograminearum]